MSELDRLTDDSARTLIERALAQPVASVEKPAWGFQNRTDIVTLEKGERLVLQRYHRRADAEQRLRVTQALQGAAAAAAIPIPSIRAADLDARPPWIVFAALPGVPVPDAGEFALGGPRFPEAARLMGELLGRFRWLSPAKLELDGLWADPARLAVDAHQWSSRSALGASERRELAALLDRVPGLFAGRPAVLAHGDFAPMNVLIDGGRITGLIDFESLRLADPLFDIAWWAWAVSFSPSGVLEAAWPSFLTGAGIDSHESELAERIDALQVLRMLELLGGDRPIDADVAHTVTVRLRARLG